MPREERQQLVRRRRRRWCRLNTSFSQRDSSSRIQRTVLGLSTFLLLMTLRDDGGVVWGSTCVTSCDLNSSTPYLHMMESTTSCGSCCAYESPNCDVNSSSSFAEFGLRTTDQDGCHICCDPNRTQIGCTFPNVLIRDEETRCGVECEMRCDAITGEYELDKSSTILETCPSPTTPCLPPLEDDCTRSNDEYYQPTNTSCCLRSCVYRRSDGSVCDGDGEGDDDGVTNACAAYQNGSIPCATSRNETHEMSFQVTTSVPAACEVDGNECGASECCEVTSVRPLCPVYQDEHCPMTRREWLATNPNMSVPALCRDTRYSEHTCRAGTTFMEGGLMPCTQCCLPCSMIVESPHNSIDVAAQDYGCRSVTKFIGTFASPYNAMGEAVQHNPDCNGFFMYSPTYGTYCCDDVGEGCQCGTGMCESWPDDPDGDVRCTGCECTEFTAGVAPPLTRMPGWEVYGYTVLSYCTVDTPPTNGNIGDCGDYLNVGVECNFGCDENVRLSTEERRRRTNERTNDSHT